LSKIREQAKACRRRIIELEIYAGIAEAAEKLRKEPASYMLIYDAAEPYSDEQQKLVAEEESFHQKRVIRRLRDIYFSVHDREIRKALIAKNREEGCVALSFWHQEVNDAAAKVEDTRLAHAHWWAVASIVGIAFIALGFCFFNLIGALCGLLVGLFTGLRMEQVARRAREQDIREAKRELKDAEQIWNEVRNEPQAFSQREASTGEPDPDSALARWV
jgi:hypothetical protein